MGRNWLRQTLGRHRRELPDFTPPQSVTVPAPLLSNGALERLREPVELREREAEDREHAARPGTIDVELVGSPARLIICLSADLVECAYAGSAVATFRRSVLSGWLRQPRGRLVGEGMTWARGGRTRASVSVTFGYSVTYEVPLGQVRRLQAIL